MPETAISVAFMDDGGCRNIFHDRCFKSELKKILPVGFTVHRLADIPARIALPMPRFCRCKAKSLVFGLTTASIYFS